MASISPRCSAIAASKAPGKCSGAMRSHGGTPPYGPGHGAVNGLSDTSENVTATRALDLILTLDCYVVRPSDSLGSSAPSDGASRPVLT